MINIIKNFITRLLLPVNKRKVANELYIRELMQYFHADEGGHRANIESADLGYGWVHYALIRNLKPTRVLCVGSGFGYVPAILAQACAENHHGHVDFVDAGYGISHRHNFTWVGFWKTLEGQLSFKNFGLGKHINLYLMKTSEFVKKYPELRYQYIYIDGDHLYKGVRYDYDHLWPLLETGGIMAFHDITVKEAQPEGKYGVWRLWNEIQNGHTIAFPHPKSGLGIIQKT